MSNEDTAVEPSPDPPLNESPFEIQPLDVEERSLATPRRDARDGD